MICGGEFWGVDLGSWRVVKSCLLWGVGGEYMGGGSKEWHTFELM